MWLPQGKRAAVCFSIDDVHPGRSSDAYEAGGDLGKGALGHLEWLLRRHPQLQATLFVTADWRELSPVPTRRLLARIPLLRERLYLTRVLPSGTMRLSRHPEFVRYLQELPRTEIALHGLHHIHRGPNIPTEFQEQSAEECARMLRAAIQIFEEAGLRFAPGMTPPGWHVPPSLAEAMVEVGLQFVASARDIHTPVSASATTNMSGMKEVSLIHPQLVCDHRLVHITTNFQATSPVDRACEIVAAGGLLSIKAHIVNQCFGMVALDGMGPLYRNYLDVVFSQLEERYGETLWWTSMGAIAERFREAAAEKSQTGRN